MRPTPHHQTRRSTRRAALFALASGAAIALGSPAFAQVLWKGAPEARPTMMTRGEMQNAAALVAARNDQRRVVVQFNAPITDGVRSSLERAGVTLLSPLGSNVFFASIDGDRLDGAALTREASLTSLRPIDAAWKTHPMLRRDEIPEWAVVDAGGRLPGEAGHIEDAEQAKRDPVIAVYVMMHADASARTEGVAAVGRHGGEVRTALRSVNVLVAHVPMSAVRALAAEDAVQWVEPALPHFDELNNSNRLRIGADIVQAAPYNLSGEGVSVMVYDGGRARATHVDFEGRLFVRDDSNLSSHATHVSGTVGGGGNASGGTYRGMAPGVTIQSYGFQQPGGLQQGFLYTDPGDMEDDYDDAINNWGAAIANNSIGTNVAANNFPCSWHGEYGVTSTVIDSIARGAFGPTISIVFAAGNERGNGRCGTGYGTTAPPANAKNHITVGALHSNNDAVTNFTSWGPTTDGRLKPDVAAPGCQNGPDAAGPDWNGGNSTVSSSTSASDTSYGSACGTSMAAPTATGAVALMLEDFRANNPAVLEDPISSTIKAVLIHTAEDIENFGPDYKTGYGSIRVQPAIEHMRSGNFTENEVSTGEIVAFEVTVGAGEDFKATLVWDDAPGTPNVYPSLVNDLDLIVTDPNGVRHYPWTLNPANPAAPAVRTQVDRINNVEQVFVENAAPGVWSVEILGHNVPVGPQTFSLSTDGDLDLGPTPLSVFATGVPTLIAPGQSTVINITINPGDDELVAGSPTLHYRTGPGSFTTTPLASVGGDAWQATLPAFSCDVDLAFYVSAEGVETGLRTTPPNAPANLFTPDVGTLQNLTIFTEGFGSVDLSEGWTATGLWNITDQCGSDACEGSLFAYYGQTSTCTYNTGSTTTGSLMSPEITLPALEQGGSITLTYCSRRTTESLQTYDLTRVRVNGTIIDQPVGNNADWQTRTVNLGAYAGQTIRLDFNFDSRDGILNDFLGWQIDNIRVTAIAAGCEDVECPGDFNGDGVVDFDDLSEILGGFGTAYDFNDLGLVLSNFGAVCNR